MKTTMDAAGRLVIPKEVRRRAGIEPGVPLDVHWRDGRIEIEPATTPVDLERRGRFLVAVPRAQIGKLTVETVEETRDAIREERNSQAHS
jgi:AbrB family looped-hinge helix DNA binding protein